MKATRLLIVIVILQALTLVSLWKGDALATPARAAVPEPGADRREMVNELKSMNDKLGSLLELMKSGKLEVQVVNPDEKKAR